jgi:hypothetical protein
MTESPAADRGGVARGLERWAPLGGILYVVLFIVGLIVASSGQPDSSSAPAKIIAYYSKGSHRDKIVLGWLILLVGTFFFIWFLGALRQTVRRLTDDGVLANVTTVGGAIYAALSVAGFSLETAIKTMSDDTYQHQVYPDLIHAASDAGYVLHSGGGVGAAAMMVGAAVAVLRARSLPLWLGWLGVVAGIVAIFSIFFFPWIVIAVWFIVASVLLFVSESRRAATP